MAILFAAIFYCANAVTVSGLAIASDLVSIWWTLSYHVVYNTYCYWATGSTACYSLADKHGGKTDEQAHWHKESEYSQFKIKLL